MRGREVKRAPQTPVEAPRLPVGAPLISRYLHADRPDLHVDPKPFFPGSYSPPGSADMARLTWHWNGSIEEGG